MIFHSPLCLQHTPPLEFDGQQMRTYPEQADRIRNIVTTLQQNGLETIEPKQFERKWIEQVHSPDYIDFIDSLPPSLEPVAPIAINTSGEISQDSSFHAKLGHYFFDPATPVMTGTAPAAFASVNCALSVAEALHKEGRAFALSRPPGHHAMAAQGGGYCIFNNVAVAANYLSRKGKSVSIVDLDYHHGNGTQQLFYNRDDVQYCSIHADPRSNYPFYWGNTTEIGAGNGRGFTNNFPVPSTTTENQYLEQLDVLLAQVANYQPDMVLVSMGFDCYIDDPIAGMQLTTDSYFKVGSALSDLDRVGVILEGGYHLPSIGQNFYQIYRGLWG